MPGSWQPLTNQPTFNASTMLLLTDGTVMCQESNRAAWWRLTPDEWGDYANGTWSALAPMIDPRLYYASAVLADGRVFVAGGEYSGVLQADWNRVEIYDPLADAWHPAVRGFARSRAALHRAARRGIRRTRGDCVDRLRARRHDSAEGCVERERNRSLDGRHLVPLNEGVDGGYVGVDELRARAIPRRAARGNFKRRPHDLPEELHVA